MDAMGLLRLATFVELVLILVSIVVLTWLFTRKPIPQYVREIAFMRSRQLTTAWYLVTSASALVGVGIAANLFPHILPSAIVAMGPVAVQILLLGGGLLLILALLQVAHTIWPYAGGAGGAAGVEQRIHRDLHRWLQTTPEEAGRIYDLHRLREQPWRQHLPGGVSVRFHRSVLFAVKRYLEAKFGWYGSQALHETGRTVGLIVGREWKDEAGPDRRESLFRALAKEGVGLLTVADEAPGRLAIRVDECAESAGVETDARFQCEFLGGFLGGIMETWWGDRVEVRETRCDARGDEACEFAIVQGVRVPVRTHVDGKTVEEAPPRPAP